MGFVKRYKNLLAYLALSIAVIVSFARVEDSFDEIRALRAARAIDQADTDQRICQRQEVVTKRLINTSQKLRETNRRLINANVILHGLISGIHSDGSEQRTPQAQRALKDARDSLASEDNALRREQSRLRKQELELMVELRSVDCAHLPSNNLPNR